MLPFLPFSCVLYRMNNWTDASGFAPLGRKLKLLVCPPNEGGCAYYRSLSPNHKLTELYSNVLDIRFNKNPLGIDEKTGKWQEDFEFEDMHWADIIMGNNISNFGGEYTARICGKAKEFGKIFHYDTDDLLTELYEGHRLKDVYDGKLSEITRFIYNNSDIVTVTQKKFADRIAPYIDFAKGHQLAVVRNSIDYNLPCWRAQRRETKFCRIGWAGGIHHEEDVKEFAGIPNFVNGRVGRENVRWDFYGRPPLNKEDPQNAWQQEVWDNYERTIMRGFKGTRNYTINSALMPDKYGVLFTNMDVAIAPLQMNAFNDSKSEIKLAECGKYSVPLIASDVGAYNEWIVNGENGVLLPPGASPKEWVRVLSKVIKDKKWRKKMGQNLHDTVIDNFDLNKTARLRLDLYEEYYTRVLCLTQP